jgi:hypothetical protein
MNQAQTLQLNKQGLSLYHKSYAQSRFLRFNFNLKESKNCYNMSKLVIYCSEETELAIMQRNFMEDLDVEKVFFDKVIVNKDKFLEILNQLSLGVELSLL